LQATVRALGASAGGASASRLLALLYDPDVDFDRIVQCLHGEPVLSARVLKVANSPYYRRSGQVGSVERALQMLGLNAVRGIAAAGALDRMLPPQAGQFFDPQRFRRHSAAVASAAQAISRQAGLGVDGEAFMAGLLHDIGALLLAKSDPAAMARFAPKAELSAEAALAEEQAHFGIDHSAAGVLIVQAWALPDWLKDAVADHHGTGPLSDPAVAPTAGGPASGVSQLPRVLLLANRMAAAADCGWWPRCGGPLEPSLWQGWRLEAEHVATMVEGLPAAVDALAAAG
jgi:putative nucleotidyltransferase with HDIG domain